MRKQSSKYLLSLFLILSLGCGTNFTPKPRGFFRIDLPKKEYRVFESACPFSFEYPEYAVVTQHHGKDTIPCWLDVVYPEFKGTLYLSYYNLQENMDSASSQEPIYKYLEDTRSLAYKHTVKARAIDEEPFANKERDVYGLIYNIYGLNTASSLQFYLTDSTEHFLRGALYFYVAPRNDSLAPVIDFVREDIYRFIDSFEWVNIEGGSPKNKIALHD